MKSFEGIDLERIDLERIHKKALRTIEQAQFKEEDFAEPYGPETVARDLATVKRKEKSNNSEHLIADIFEAIVLEHGELSEWFGEQAFTFKTSKYDDYENKVDAIIEIRDRKIKSASYLGLAADVTFNNDSTKKFDGIKRKIDSGQLGLVKYFHSEHMNIHGQKSKLPEVIIGADKKTVLELADHWIAGENSKLAKHRIQIMILEQIVAQLDTFSIYADSIGQTEASQIYRDTLLLVNEILAEKNKLRIQVQNDLNDDSVHYGIISFLSSWRQMMEREKNMAA